MKNSLNLITLALLTLIPFYLISQRLDVQGDSRFRGHIDVAASPDSSSVYVGKGAGVNATTTNKNNSFFGREAGRNNTTGKDN
ncbi:MAG TPA: hypothetical protein PKC30_15295, partial [Saprospiraceae bacterium]|nr:hypothetical protein [Saprospiraceae bacterium]